jgi:chemotaxis protein methyltransferase CheR
MTAQKNDDLRKILSYLADMKKLDFFGYRQPMIERRVAGRSAACGMDDYGSYLQYLKENSGELDHLIDALTINVSRFFRETFTFEYISDFVLPAIIASGLKTTEDTIRVWSAGCASGEEPYSIAILFKELAKKEGFKSKLQIFATDIDEQSLRKAKEGVYEIDRIQNVKYGLLNQYFTPFDESFALIPEIKEMVDFSFYDINDTKTVSPPESVFGSFDLVLCRNVLIYLRPEHQNLIFNKLHRSISGDGFLVLGEAEALSAKYTSRFSRVNEKVHIYQKIPLYGV